MAKTNKKTFIIPVTWECYGEIEVEASTLEEAVEKFDKKEKLKGGYSLPEGTYRDMTFQREKDYKFIEMINNNEK